MSHPSPRLTRRVRRDFGPQATEALKILGSIPETLPLADKQSPERLQAAALLRAGGDLQQLHRAISLAQQDWRDLLMYTGLEHADWQDQLTNTFGEADDH